MVTRPAAKLVLQPTQFYARGEVCGDSSQPICERRIHLNAKLAPAVGFPRKEPRGHSLVERWSARVKVNYSVDAFDVMHFNCVLSIGISKIIKHVDSNAETI